MAVQFVDKALDEWLADQIKEWGRKRTSDDGLEAEYNMGYYKALRAVRIQLHEFWGAALAPNHNPIDEEP